MAYIPELQDYSPAPAEAVKSFLSEDRRKSIKDEVERIVDDEFDRLEEHANDHISQVAAGRATAYVTAILEGDDNAAMRLLGSPNNGDRYRLFGLDEGKPWASVIGGNVFETSGITLRRKIVEAHADLLSNERIKDLESIVEGLTIQIRKQESEIESLRERYR